jgi:hypothetical protein
LGILLIIYHPYFFLQDFIIVPNDAKWEKVHQCTTGKVFLLDYGSDDRRHFYWLQDPNPEKFEQLYESVLNIVNPSDDEGEISIQIANPCI